MKKQPDEMPVAPPNQTAVHAMEKHLSVQQVAKMWGLGENTVRRMFEDLQGVLKISQPRLNGAHAKRAPRTILRIPESLVIRVHEDWSRGFLAKV